MYYLHAGGCRYAVKMTLFAAGSALKVGQYSHFITGIFLSVAYRKTTWLLLKTGMSIVTEYGSNCYIQSFRDIKEAFFKPYNGKATTNLLLWKVKDLELAGPFYNKNRNGLSPVAGALIVILSYLFGVRSDWRPILVWPSQLFGNYYPRPAQCFPAGEQVPGNIG